MNGGSKGSKTHVLDVVEMYEMAPDAGGAVWEYSLINYLFGDSLAEFGVSHPEREENVF